MASVLPGNFSVMSSRNAVRDYWPGWDLIRLRGSAWIGPTPATSWDIVDESSGALLGISTTAAGAVPTGSVWVWTASMRIPSQLIATVAGEGLKVAQLLANPSTVIAGVSAGGVMPAAEGYSPLSNAPTTNQGLLNTVSANVHRLFLVPNATPTTAPAGLVAAPTARGVRIPVELLCLRRSSAVQSGDLLLSEFQQRQDAGVL